MNAEAAAPVNTNTGDLPTIEFVCPMPGFVGNRRFVLVRMDDSGVLFSLRSLDDENLRFLVISPNPFFPEYEPEIDDAALAMLGAGETSNLLVLLIVTAPGSITEATANLLAPIVVDTDTRRAIQTVLTGSDLPVRAPLVSA
ncbi:flagellar assembly protein FliW [Planomonospora venezuelensis]|uniref:Flagellar assembly factor FliW n=1 Tax=Planomonospora venezuelensis TaxID=1999 RepID=A0A841DIH5_PLAVE|nr:flagellar assembly protein FliW [Planomonospora venezuelensis]MBB5968164.1 flagellar assembly factor FliW [Planomonospora venezuelensis]GIN01947.1 flagellar assembly factor FliW [Planomonospora venezuelensis]